jgi:rubredoxin
MPDTRECPLCGGTMTIKRAEAVVRVPGYSTTTTRIRSEWVCPDCDYFEEADEGAEAE